MNIYYATTEGGWVAEHTYPGGFDRYRPCNVTFLQPGQKFLWSGAVLETVKLRPHSDGNVGVWANVVAGTFPDANPALWFTFTAQVLAAPYSAT